MFQVTVIEKIENKKQNTTTLQPPPPPPSPSSYTNIGQLKSSPVKEGVKRRRVLLILFSYLFITVYF